MIPIFDSLASAFSILNCRQLWGRRVTSKALSNPEAATSKFLIFHADDAGMCNSVNQATIQALENGLVTSTSIMVPTPQFAEFADYAKKNCDRDFGIHLTLTSEWKSLRWKPLLPREKVESLVDCDGYFWKDVVSVARNVLVSDVEAELTAQIERAIANDIPCLLYTSPSPRDRG